MQSTNLYDFHCLHFYCSEHNIEGKNNRAKRACLDLERKLQKLISYFEDSEYKKFILNSYSLVFDEWMLSSYNDDSIDNEEKLKESFISMR